MEMNIVESKDPSYDDFEHFCEIMRENDEQILKEQREFNRINQRIFRAIESVKGQSFLNNLHALIHECEGIVGSARITRKHEGETWVPEYYSRQIQGYWVTQYTGYVEDSFYGVISVKIRKNRYFTFDYAC